MLATLGFGCATSKTSYTKEERVRPYLDMAATALTENSPVEALKYLEEASAIDADNPDVAYMSTRAHHARQDYARALVSIRKYLELMPKSSDGQLTLGIILIEMGKPKEAIAPLTKAANDHLYERASQAQTNLGILHYRQGAYKDAEAWFARAITEAPATACVAYYYRGHLRLRESKFREAKESYELSTQKFCGAFAEGFLALGIAYQQLNDFDHARRTYLEVEKRFPNTKVADQAMERLKKLP